MKSVATEFEKIRCRDTQYGFTYGAAEVTRLASHKGSVILEVTGRKGQNVRIYVTKKGLIRVQEINGKPPEKRNPILDAF